MLHQLHFISFHQRSMRENTKILSVILLWVVPFFKASFKKHLVRKIFLRLDLNKIIEKINCILEMMESFALKIFFRLA